MSASVVGASSSEALLCYKITTLPFWKKKNMVTLKNTLFCGKAADMLMSRVNITQVKVRNMPYIRFYDRCIYCIVHFIFCNISQACICPLIHFLSQYFFLYFRVCPTHLSYSASIVIFLFQSFFTLCFSFSPLRLSLSLR